MQGEILYDFTQAVQKADVKIQFTQMRVLQNICVLPNFHVLIEGGFMDFCVEVYELGKEKGYLKDPLRVIKTDCRGLNAVEYS